MSTRFGEGQASNIEAYSLAQDGHPNAYQNLLVAKELKRRLLDGDALLHKGWRPSPMRKCSNESMYRRSLRRRMHPTVFHNGSSDYVNRVLFATSNRNI